MPIIEGKILEGSTIHTDGWKAYDGLVLNGYDHYRVFHSKDEFVRYNKLINLSQKVWEDAKDNNDFNAFKGNLEEIVEFNRKFIDYYEIDDHPYNVLLDEYEDGMSMKEYSVFFETLKVSLERFRPILSFLGRFLSRTSFKALWSSSAVFAIFTC